MMVSQYIEQSHESEMNLHVELGKKDSAIEEWKKKFSKFENNELQFRMMMKLYEEKLTRLRK